MNATLLQIALSYSLLIPLATGAVADPTHPTTPPDLAGQTNQAEPAEPAREPRPPLTVNLNIESQLLGNALNEFGQQTGLQVIFFYSDVPLLTSPRLAGKFHPRVALEALLADTPLAYRFINPRTVAIVARGSTVPENTLREPVIIDRPLRLAEVARDANESGSGSSKPRSEIQLAEAMDAESVGAKQKSPKSATPEMLVKGSKLLNADIRRTRDDIQPYVVFDSNDIAQSQATSLEDFLKTRLPMNTVQGVFSQTPVLGTGNYSRVDLRGLGTNQTLILVDGRRLPGLFNIAELGSDFSQPDINGIPLSAVERVEVLPSTASGIYGGGATGGVVNIILRRDYSGVQVEGSYGNTFDTDAGMYKLNGSAGFSFEEGKTRLYIAASRSDSNPLRVSERDFSVRARSLFRANNPGGILDSPFFIPLGFTTNITSADGSDLVLDDGTELNSARTYVPIGYAGPVSDGGAALAIHAGEYNWDLPDDLNGARQSLLATPTVESAMLNLRRSFNEHIDAYLDLSWNRNEATTFNVTSMPAFIFFLPESASNNPFSTSIHAAIPAPGLSFPTTVESKMVTGTAGLIVPLPGGWSMATDYTWSRARYSSTLTSNAVGTAFEAAIYDGTLDIMRDLNVRPLDYSPFLARSPDTFIGPNDTILQNVISRVSGPVIKLPGGPMTLAGLVEYREIRLDDSFTDTASFVHYHPRRSQNVRSTYAEVNIPVVSAFNKRPLVNDLEIQLSARHDRYKTRSVPTGTQIILSSRSDPLPPISYSNNEANATKYTAGLRYAPVSDIALRVSFGTGFLPSSIAQVAPNSPFTSPFPSFLIDHKRGGILAAVGPFSEIRGGNPDLRPEESESFSAGLILTPRFTSGLRLSIDYTRIDKTDEIVQLGLQELLDHEDLFPGRVIRGDNLPGDPPGWSGPVDHMDITLVNAAKTRVEAYDFQVNYEVSTRTTGSLGFYAMATMQTRLERQLVESAPLVDRAGFSDGPLKWRGNAGVVWDWGSWTTGWSMQYYDSYLVYSSTDSDDTRDFLRLSQGSDKIPSQIYHDTFVRYRIDELSVLNRGFLKESELTIGVQNVFDRSPPIIASPSELGGYSAYGDPRLRRYLISFRKSF